jgi:chromosome segregation ATPase
MDVQKTMEFLLEQQAAIVADRQGHAAEIKELRASTEALKALVLAHESDIQVHTKWLSGLSAAMQRLTDQMQDGFVKMAAANKETREYLNSLAAANKETREYLNSLAAANKETRENLNSLAVANAAANKETRDNLNILAAANKETRDNLDILVRTVQDMNAHRPKQ